MDPYRRAAFALTIGAALWPLGVSADTRRYAVMSLLADKFDVVVPEQSVGSRLDQNRRQTFEDKAGVFDLYASAAVEQAIQRIDKAATVTLLALPRTSRLYDQPDRIFDGRSVVLPGSVVDALVAAKVSQLVLLTKHRDETRLPLVDGTTGLGTLRGLGFYVDPNLRLINRDSGERNAGVLAPFVYVRLWLVDVAKGEVVRDRAVRAMATYVPSHSGALHAWDVLNAEQKVEALRGLLERELAAAVPGLLDGG